MKFFQGALRTGNFDTRRLDAFSDGVFAIVVTLLVLEIRVPHAQGPHAAQELIHGLMQLLPKFFSYILSFVYITIYWVNHHLLFNMIERTDRGIFWFNSLFLMFLAFIPFPTAMIGEYPHEATAVIFYGVIMFLTGACFGLMKWYAVEYAHLVDPELEKGLYPSSLFKIVIGPVLYLVAIFAAFMNTHIAIAIYVVIPVIYFFPGKLEKSIANVKRRKNH